MNCKETNCRDIFLRNTQIVQSACKGKNKSFTSLIDSINCWVTEGKIDLTGFEDIVTLIDNGDGTSDIIYNEVSIGTVITTATNVTLIDNGDGTSNLFVNSIDLGIVINDNNSYLTEEDLVSIPIYNSIQDAIIGIGLNKLFRYSETNSHGVVSPNDSVIGITK